MVWPSASRWASPLPRCRAFEYYELLAHEGWKFGGDQFYSNFFMATGFHGFHVIIGTIFLSVCLIRALKR